MAYIIASAVKSPGITVVELPSYLARAEIRMSEAERAGVVTMIANEPKCGVVIRRTGGIRKVRFAIGAFVVASSIAWPENVVFLCWYS